jgi:peroxiredoxin
MKLLLIAILFSAIACSHTGTSKTSPITLANLDGSRIEHESLLSRTPWTVFFFVAHECPCMSTHAARLKELAQVYAPRGVQFFGVDSEVGTTPAIAAAEARELSVPVVIDSGAKLADYYGAEFATFSVVVSREGFIRYQGGLDSDKQKLHADAIFYVRDALDDVLAGKPARRFEGKTLGCVLRRW